MKYNIESIINRYNSEESLKYVFFWGHRKRKDGQIGQSCLSQWWESDFEVEGITYKSAEHWMMAEKAKLFGDKEIFQKIIESNSPGEAKKWGRKVRNFDNEIWLKNRFDIVSKGNYHKFSKIEELGDFLIKTENRILVEASPVDPIWGIGLAKDAKNIENPITWKGLNLLGFALMEVRDIL